MMGRSLAIDGEFVVDPWLSEEEAEGWLMAISDEDKRRRAELAKELGYFPATLDPEDIEEHRRHNAAADRAGDAERVHKRYAHLREQRRRAEVEARGRADVADLYE